MEATKTMKGYFAGIKKNLDKVYKVAQAARAKGLDPEDRVDIPIASNMAERVEGLISIVSPQIVGTAMTKRIGELEKEHGALDWRVGFKIAVEAAQEKFCKFKDKKEAMEVGIRVGFAYLTGGIVSAPLEGFLDLQIKNRKDGREYFSLHYAGPIRGAGGTAAATSVILADYVRVKMGYAPYDPTEDEVNRFITEVNDYHERAVNLQYLPSPEEVRFLAEHVPVEINGAATEDFEVSNYKDLPRVETDFVRGGLCLVLAEGLSQKAAKLWKRLGKWGKEFGLDWDFLADFLVLQKKIKARTETKESEEKPKITPNYTYIADLVAGRPVLTDPLKNGGFRLRFGRSRVSGFSAASIHPATMILFDNFVATGTQLKVERPGKAAAITPCDTIEGPIVKLRDGSVVYVGSEQQAKQIKDDVIELIYLGDILFNYGDFSENGHVLVPCGYCEEWWVQEFESAAVERFGGTDTKKLAELVSIDELVLNQILSSPLRMRPTAKQAITISQQLNIALHPYYTYHWNSVGLQQLVVFLEWAKRSRASVAEKGITKIVLPLAKEPKRVLEILGVPHTVVNKEFVIVEKDAAQALAVQLGFYGSQEPQSIPLTQSAEDSLSYIKSIAEVAVKDKNGTFIGARMGRPEKAKMRKLTGAPHVLFPVGEEGGRLRSFQTALEIGKVRSNFPIYYCKQCDTETIYRVCETCKKRSQRRYYSQASGIIETEHCPSGSHTLPFTVRDIDITRYFNAAVAQLGERTYPDLIKGVRGTSNKEHIPENLAKGILRAKHGVYVNKDGTTRFDMSELPITHFRPKEIKTPIAKLRELGYTHDCYGKPLENPEQIVELKPQDVVLPGNKSMEEPQGDEVLFRVSKFVDDLLERFYGLKPYYCLEGPQDLVGHLVIGLAPHISAGMIGRVIGFSQTQGCFAHPMWHAALRRDCDGDEACVILLLDALLNFSREFLPDKRGSRTMDSPLVLTSLINPSEVDDQAHGVDVAWKYPVLFYEAAQNYVVPWDVKIEQIRHRLGKPEQYEQMGFTHDVTDINSGVVRSAYKSLPSMAEKIEGQMKLAEKIRAVNTSNVAELVIEKHLLKDTKGNLRTFSKQQFRCVKCNTKYRRPPLVGKCTECGGRIIFTVSEGSVIKYLEPTLALAKRYDVNKYLKQTIELLQYNIMEVFGKEKERQEGLGKWVA